MCTPYAAPSAGPRMLVIAVIEDPQVVEPILWHVAVSHDPPPRPPPHGLPEFSRGRPGRGFGGRYRQSEMSQAEVHYL
jgi:hypothetical protein